MIPWDGAGVVVANLRVRPEAQPEEEVVLNDNGRAGLRGVAGPAPAPYNGAYVLSAALHHARTSPPATMKAAAIDRFGPPKALTLHDLPVPKPGPRDLLIALHAAAVSGWDAEVRSGSWWPGGRRKFPPKK